MAAQPRVEYSIQHPVETTRTNLMKSLDLAMACAQSSTKIIFSSTAAIYGNTEIVPTPEDEPCQSTNPYGVAKACTEQFFKLFQDLARLIHRK